MQTEALPALAHVARVELRVADLARALAFYERTLGMRVHVREDHAATLGSAFPFLRLVEDPRAPPRPPRTTGLFHVAYLMPDRAALARVLRHLVQARWPIEGASDHLVSEALYLSDPEGNGIEIYADRPRETWHAPDGSLKMATQRLDVDDLLAQDERPWPGVPDAARVGHIHLQVADVPAAEAFYRALGLDLTARYGADASFLSAGGYHHHVGINAWGTRGAPAPPDGARGLVEFTMSVPTQADVDAVEKRLPGARREGDDVVARDPSGNVLRVTARAA